MTDSATIPLEFCQAAIHLDRLAIHAYLLATFNRSKPLLGVRIGLRGIHQWRVVVRRVIESGERINSNEYVLPIRFRYDATTEPESGHFIHAHGLIEIASGDGPTFTWKVADFSESYRLLDWEPVPESSGD